ncbi:MAG: GTPase [Planctomycetota bacterium]
MPADLPQFAFYRATGHQPGAIAIYEVVVPEEPRALMNMGRVLDGICGRQQADNSSRPAPAQPEPADSHWSPGRIRLATIGADIDRGLIAVITPARAQIMPHGGPRVVQRMARFLADDLGGQAIDPAALDPRVQFPEATTLTEGLMLQALVRAQSSKAVDVLLAQPARWTAFHRWLAEAQSTVMSAEPLFRPEQYDALRDEALFLNRLIDPPTVVVAGSPNVGKSTLMNALMGREASITADLRGTTRDWVGAMVDLRGLTVRWIDTPGLHETDDPIEAEAIRLARTIIDNADLLIAASEPGGVWPDLPRTPDLRLLLKADRLPDKANGAPHPGSHARSRSTGSPRPTEVAQRAAEVRGAPSAEHYDLSVSTRTGAGLADLVQLVRDRLVPPDLIATQSAVEPVLSASDAERHLPSPPRPWLFDNRLLTGVVVADGA